MNLIIDNLINPIYYNNVKKIDLCGNQIRGVLNLTKYTNLQSITCELNYIINFT